MRTGVAIHHGKITKLNPMVFGISLNGLDHIGKESLGDKNPRLFLGAGRSHLDSLSGGGRAVVHGGVADIQPCQGANHALELKNIP